MTTLILSCCAFTSYLICVIMLRLIRLERLLLEDAKIEDVYARVSRNSSKLRKILGPDGSKPGSGSGRAASVNPKAMNKTMPHTIDDIIEAVAQEDTLIDSASALFASVKQQLADALANTTVPAEVQAKIDQVFASLEADKTKLATAFVANTPAAPQ